jgi:hypothetical protein
VKREGTEYEGDKKEHENIGTMNTGKKKRRKTNK